MPPLRTAALASSVGRALLGSAMVASPERFGEGWIGEPGRFERVAVLVRSVGARDVALGGLTAYGLVTDRGEMARTALAGQALSDLVDLVATLAVRDKIPGRSLRLVGALAGGSALLTAAAAAGLDS